MQQVGPAWTWLAGETRMGKFAGTNGGWDDGEHGQDPPVRSRYTVVRDGPQYVLRTLSYEPLVRQRQPEQCGGIYVGLEVVVLGARGYGPTRSERNLTNSFEPLPAFHGGRSRRKKVEKLKSWKRHTEHGSRGTSMDDTKPDCEL